MAILNQSDLSKLDPSAVGGLKSDLLDHLRNQIRGVETAGRMDDGSRVSSGSAVIDRLLPVGGGYANL